MKTNQPKLKTTPRTALFSCGFFRHCTQTVLSPTTTTTPPPLPLTPPPPPPPPPAAESSSSSSSNTSQSFTQWKFPLSTNSPMPHHPKPQPQNDVVSPSPPQSNTTLDELFHLTELQFSSDSETGRFNAVHLLEKYLVPNPRAAVDGGACPETVMVGVVECLRHGGLRRPASKVLLALCLAERNRPVAVEARAVTAVVEALTDAEGAVAERALAALELLCTAAEGAAEVRAHALAVPMMVEVMGRMEGRGKEHAMSVLAVIYGGLSGGGNGVAPAEEVARAVMLALQGECSERGRRKGAQLLKILQESSEGRLDLTQDES